tara:strand:- start:350 stop:1162 length:813 start_codon:yes stop_codon:yes gene_type:complete
LKYPKLKIIAILALACGCILYVDQGLTPKVNNVELRLAGGTKDLQPLRIALLSDLHVADNVRSLEDLDELWSDVLLSHPDIIMLAGDYVNNGGQRRDISQLRLQISRVIGAAGDIPVVAVLGNHDQWSKASLWARDLRAAGIIVLENQVATLDSLGVCVRGFGDAFTGQFSYIDFPARCDGKLHISLAHDPAAAFDPRIRGLVLAGHTHCGQIALPFVGPLYVPSAAPKEAHCGIYEDGQRQVFVSSGVGTSVIPLRLFAQSQWDLITLN